MGCLEMLISPCTFASMLGVNWGDYVVTHSDMCLLVLIKTHIICSFFYLMLQIMCVLNI